MHFAVEDLIQYAPLLAQGILTTVVLSVMVIGSALVLGIIIAVTRFFGPWGVIRLLDVTVILVRSIPCIMLIALIHFGVFPLLEWPNNFFLSAYVGLLLYTTAYVAEILRAGLMSLHREALETAKSLGLNFFQCMWHIVIPLMLYRVRPALINQFVTLIKDTSLASIIGVVELTRAAEIISERTLHEVTLLIFISAVYFLMCYSLSRWARRFDGAFVMTA